MTFAIKVVYETRIINKIHEQNKYLKEERKLILDSLYLDIDLVVVVSIITISFDEVGWEKAV